MTARAPITVLHLRQSSGGGGGADTVLRQLLTAAKSSTVLRCFMAYLHKPHHDVSVLATPLREASVTVHEVPGGAWIDRAQVKALSGLIVSEGIDILHSHDVKSDVLAWWLRRRHPGLKIVATLHGWTAKSLKGRLYERLDRWVLKRFDSVITVSEATRNRSGLRHAVVIPNAIDTDKWKPEEHAPGTPFTVGFIGRLSREKNPAAVVEVAAHTRDLHFRIAGEGPERDAVTARIAETGLRGRVELVGQLAPEDLPAFYASLDAVVSTSRTEGLPMNLLEAGAMALPVVATDVGGVSELIEDGKTGHLCPFGDWACLADRLDALRGHPDTSRGMGREARERAEAHFSLARAVQRVETLYRDLTGSPGRGSP